jgi:hypothetical protein
LSIIKFYFTTFSKRLDVSVALLNLFTEAFSMRMAISKLLFYSNDSNYEHENFQPAHNEDGNGYMGHVGGVVSHSLFAGAGRQVVELLGICNGQDDVEHAKCKNLVAAGCRCFSAKTCAMVTRALRLSRCRPAATGLFHNISLEHGFQMNQGEPPPPIVLACYSLA